VSLLRKKSSGKKKRTRQKGICRNGRVKGVTGKGVVKTSSGGDKWGPMKCGVEDWNGSIARPGGEEGGEQPAELAAPPLRENLKVVTPLERRSLLSPKGRRGV